MTFLYDTQSLVQRYWIKLIRNPTLLATSLGTPIAFLLLFSQLLGSFGNFLPPGSGSYLAYLTPGVVLLNSMTGAPLGGVSLANDINSGFLSKMLLTQVARPAILLGRLLTDISVVILQSVIALVVAFALGVRVAYGLPGVALMLVTTAVFMLALSGVFLFVGIRSRKAETISAVSGVLFFPLIFVSNAMFPVSFFPKWAQTVSSYNPVSYAATVMRELVIGGINFSTVVTAYAAIGLIAIAAFAATWYQFRKVVS